MPELNVPAGSVESAAGEPPDIPGHKLLRRIGRGSYGEVWLAQTPEGEFRAVKIVYRHTFERERPFEREFSGIQKFEPVSRAHPSQVSILQVGRNDEAGFFYYAMELADDEVSGREINPASYKPNTLRSEVTRAGRIPYDRALDISLSLTKALEHLHQHGLIHRDIKPSNIIFVHGVPKLADIGLVTDVGASISYVGTEGFLPPEGPVSQQADIYSLGKVLYELSTGQDRLEFPELPTFLGESAEKDGLLELNLVFLKACQNDPQKRYRTAQEMWADLAVLRSGKSLKRTRALERRLSNITRSFALTLIAGLLAVAAYYAWNRHQVRKLEDENAAQKRERYAAEKATRDQTRKLVNTYLANGERAVRDGDIGGSLAWLAAALREETDAAHATAHENRIRKALEAFPKFVGFIEHAGGINSALFSRDSTLVITAGKDATVKIWDAGTGQLVGKPLRHRSPVRWAQLSPDRQRLFSICEDNTAWLWKVSPDETVAFELADTAAIWRGEFSPDGRFLFTRGESKRVIVWDALNARERFKFDHDDVPVQVRYSPDGRCLGVAAGNKLTFWDTTRGEKISQAISPHHRLGGLAFSPDSRRAVTTTGKIALICNVADGEWSAVTLRESSNFKDADFTPDNRSVIGMTEEGGLRRWDLASGNALSQSWQAQTTPNSIAVSPDSSAAALAGNNYASIIDFRSNQRIMPSAPHRRAIGSVAFSTDARLVLTADADGAVWLCELFSGSTKNAGLQPALNREGLIAMTRLLSGREINADEQLAEVPPDRLLADWQQLGTNVAFKPTPSAEWHADRAERLCSDQLWFAVRFHADRLRNLGVLDARAREWDDKAAQQLARNDVPEKVLPRIHERPAEAGVNLIDLTSFYNAGLTDTWLPASLGGQSNSLAELPSGLQKFNGVFFDVRGIIQLSGSGLENLGGNFPAKVTGIPIDRLCTNLHFLHGTAWDARYGTVIGKYVVHYANGETREAKIAFGRNIRDWWFPPAQPQLTLDAAVAWHGYNPASRQVGMGVRVYQYKWKNPLPDVKITKVDFVSSMEKPAPFLLAITAEPAD